MLREDDDPAAVDWVQREFDALWHSPFALDLSEAVVQDIGRIAARVLVPDLDAWRTEPEPAVERLLSDWETLDDAEDDQETLSELKTLTQRERALLERFMKALATNREQDPKLHAVRDLLLERGWLELGCILFSQYYDSAYWLAEQLSGLLPEERIGIYAGA